jgi:hypothetical protein
MLHKVLHKVLHKTLLMEVDKGALSGVAQTGHLETGRANAATHVSQMACEGQALQMAHWLGSLFTNQYTQQPEHHRFHLHA